MSAPEDAGRTAGEPTPRPWRTGWLVSYNGATGEPEAFIYRLPPNDPRETADNRICVRGAEGAMDCDADARYIVRAVNSFADLVRVSERAALMMGCLCNFLTTDEKCLPCAARAALEKAK